MTRTTTNKIEGEGRLVVMTEALFAQFIEAVAAYTKNKYTVKWGKRLGPQEVIRIRKRLFSPEVTMTRPILDSGGTVTHVEERP